MRTAFSVVRAAVFGLKPRDDHIRDLLDQFFQVSVHCQVLGCRCQVLATAFARAFFVNRLAAQVAAQDGFCDLPDAAQRVGQFGKLSHFVVADVRIGFHSFSLSGHCQANRLLTRAVLYRSFLLWASAQSAAVAPASSADRRTRKTVSAKPRCLEF